MSAAVLFITSDVSQFEHINLELKVSGWHCIHALDAAQGRHLLLDQKIDVDVVVVDSRSTANVVYSIAQDPALVEENVQWILIMDDEQSFSESFPPYAIVSPNITQRRLISKIERALKETARQRQQARRHFSHQNSYHPKQYLGRSQAAQEVRELVLKLASVPLDTFIITGETGTGKSMVAKIIHYNGARKREAFIEINCASLPYNLLESELFGYEAGAFTGATKRKRGLLEVADRGTLFLDEIGELELSLQSKILTAIEQRQFRRVGGEQMIYTDLQIIAATHRNLEQAVIDGTFRQDLYHRLNVFCLPLPALRERIEDLDDLVPNIVREYCLKADKPVLTMPIAVMEKLKRYSWPGNIRELRNVLERCVLLSDGDAISDKWLNLGNSVLRAPKENEKDGIFISLVGETSLDEIERQVISKMLEQCEGNVSEAARLLAVSRETLRYRIKKYHIDEVVG